MDGRNLEMECEHDSEFHVLAHTGRGKQFTMTHSTPNPIPKLSTNQYPPTPAHTVILDYKPIHKFKIKKKKKTSNFINFLKDCFSDKIL